jgi:hypothetical protein
MKFDGFEMLRQIKVPKIAYHLDYYFGISRQTNLENDPFWHCDFVFQPDGDHLDEFKNLGINTYFSPPAIFKDACYLLDRPKNHELIFVGSYNNYHGEWPWRRDLINKLYTYPQFELYPQGENVVREEALNELYASTKVVVGDSLCLPNNKTYTSDRIFETTGRGGFILFPKIEYLTKIFPKEIFYEVADWDSLHRKIDYYLEHHEERETLRLKCHEITKKNHTYMQRLKKMLEVINGKA